MSGPNVGHTPRLGVLALSGLSGYVALSQEIVWYRVISYETGGSPFGFAHLLAVYLLGIALGALCGEGLSRSSRPTAQWIPWLFVASAVLGFVTVPAAANARLVMGNAGFAYAYGCAALVAFPGGLLFPLLVHHGTPQDVDVGRPVSYLYLANVVGSTLGPLVTTFILMDMLALPWLVTLVSGFALAAAGLAAFVFRGSSLQRAWVGGVCGVVLVLLAGPGRAAYLHLYEKLHFGPDYDASTPYVHQVENRSGVIAVGGPDGADVIYGGGVYDGRFNLDVLNDSNGLFRALMISGLHRKPTEVLSVGLASGSWLALLASMPGVERATYVEINPGYADLLASYPVHARVLHERGVVGHIDDGRRWLRRNPDRKFDFILMNTTLHWRSHASDLLSQEMFELCKAHLQPGGVLYLNATGSADVRRTVAEVFRHVVQVGNFVAGSDAPFDVTPEERRAVLTQWALDGQPLFLASSPAQVKRLESVVQFSLVDEGETLRRNPKLQVVTDNNMRTEFPPFPVQAHPERRWTQLLSRWRLAPSPP